VGSKLDDIYNEGDPISKECDEVGAIRSFDLYRADTKIVSNG
jgi:hypothetical protein